MRGFTQERSLTSVNIVIKLSLTNGGALYMNGFTWIEIKRRFTNVKIVAKTFNPNPGWLNTK